MITEILKHVSSNIWYYIEVIVITLVIIYQIIHSSMVYSNIKKLKNVFRFKLFLRNAFIEKDKIGKVDSDTAEIYYEDKIDLDEESIDEYADTQMIKLPLVDTEGNNDTILRIKEAINNYLINNYGAVVNFSIIKDIVDREIEVKDEEISQTITVPLYLGLASTMIGVIFGLFSMPKLNVDGIKFGVGVSALIAGVKIAMFGSLFGLVLTSWLSSFVYKKAKRNLMRNKNEQLSYLQARLLPELIKAEDTGVTGLKSSLDRFARVATEVFDNIMKASDKTGENLKMQMDLMEKVNNMKILKVSKWNIELFEKMERNMDALNNFSGYISNLDQISSRLFEFSKRTSDIHEIISNIESTLNESKQLTKFLSSHFEKIDHAGSSALKAVGLAEAYFEEAINQLKERTEKMINQLYSEAGNQESKLEDIYNEIQANLSQITSEYVNTFKTAYENSIPKFEQLDHLNLLPEIKQEISGKGDAIAHENKQQAEILKSNEQKLNSSLQTIINKLDGKRFSNIEKSNGGSKKATVTTRKNADTKVVSIGNIIKDFTN